MGIMVGATRIGARAVHPVVVNRSGLYVLNRRRKGLCVTGYVYFVGYSVGSQSGFLTSRILGSFQQVQAATHIG